MKADLLRLAWLFHDAGMIGSETFDRVVSGEQSKEKSALTNVFSQLSRDVSMDLVRDSLKSVRDLMLMEVRLPSSDSGAVPQASQLHDALSQPIYLTDNEIRPIILEWRPPVDELRRIIEEAGDANTRAKLAGLAEGDDVHEQLVSAGLLSARTLNRAASTLHLPICKLNRILLALSVLKSNDAIDEETYEAAARRAHGEDEHEPQRLDEEFIAFVKSAPDMPEVLATEIQPDDDLAAAFPEAFMRRNLFMPVRITDDELIIATPDPFYAALCDTLSVLTGRAVVGLHVPATVLIGRINEMYPGEDAQKGRAVLEGEGASEATAEVAPSLKGDAEVVSAVERRSAVEIVSSVIENGIASRATDVHMEPRDGRLRVRYRIDGHLRPVMEIPADLAVSVISRIKVLGSLNVTERRQPQDGHFSLRFDQGAFDFRISTLPTHQGEKIVIRILDESRVMLDLEALGMEKKQVAQFAKWIHRPHGLILVTGPTGSGKTSTLYAGLNTVSDDSKNIVTIEDPVEYRLDGINQVQVDANIDLTFARGLRATLRQDPDVIMVGEIRDPETAYIAMRAALTGHMVMSTLHTNTAAGAIATLGQMGVEPFMIVSAVSGTVSQRLIRCLCESCKKSFQPKKELREALGLSPQSRKRMHRSVGCVECLQTGYRGRIGVFELLEMTDAIAEGVMQGESESELIRISREAGVPSIFDAALAKARAGVTAPEEILEKLAVD